MYDTLTKVAAVTTPTNTRPSPGSAPVAPPVQAMKPSSGMPWNSAPTQQQTPADPVGGKPAPLRKNNWFDNVMENPWLQGAVMASTIIPGVNVIGAPLNLAFQGVDMARNLANGDRGKALANAAFMIPGVGTAAKLGKGALVAGAAAKGVGAAGKATAAWKGAQAASQGIKATQQAQAAAKTAELAAKGITRGRAATMGINTAMGAAKMAPVIGVGMYGANNFNNEQRHQTLMDQYNSNVADYTSQSPVHQLHYDLSQQSQAGNLQPWGSQ